MAKFLRDQMIDGSYLPQNRDGRQYRQLREWRYSRDNFDVRHPFPQRFAAAAFAISDRRSGVILAARAFPPRLPSSAAAFFAESVSTSSVSSPVAIRMTLTALPITSAARFSPRGPLGIGLDPVAAAEFENPGAATPMTIAPNGARVPFRRVAADIPRARY
jgi:hypothetical protein